jgi:hypothetical protein
LVSYVLNYGVFVPSRGSSKPWTHTKDEWRGLMEALKRVDQDEAQSLEYECPHIVRALKMFSRMHNGRRSLISHPRTGLSRDRILKIAKDQLLSKQLTVFSQDVVDSG